MTMLRRILIASALAVAIASVPSHAAAQRETPPQAKASASGNLSTLWSELAAWFRSEVAPPPPHTGSGATTDEGISWDPWG